MHIKSIVQIGQKKEKYILMYSVYLAFNFVFEIYFLLLDFVEGEI